MSTVEAPFTYNQVWSLNAYQDSSYFHPYTCPQCRDNADAPARRAEDRLVATPFGWCCRNTFSSGCTYTQNWAHDWAADWSWRRRLDEEARRHVLPTASTDIR